MHRSWSKFLGTFEFDLVSKIFVSGRLFSDSCKFLHVSDSNAQIDGRPNNHSLYRMYKSNRTFNFVRLIWSNVKFSFENIARDMTRLSRPTISQQPESNLCYSILQVYIFWSRLYVSQKVDVTARLRSLVSLFEIKGAFS